MWLMFYFFGIFTLLGITMGYHRLITHRAYKSGRIFGGILLGAGAMALEREIDWWATAHQIHHARTEVEKQDPHTPHEGFLWAHILWIWFPYKYSKRLWDRYAFGFINANTLVSDQKKYYLIAVFAGFFIPAIVFGLWGIFFVENASLGEGLLWAGKGVLLVSLLRLTLVYNITFSVNSWAHTWGPDPYENSVTGDSKDAWILAFFSFGETLQNTHHLLQDRALYWIKPHYFDMSGALIVALASLRDVYGFRWLGLPYTLNLMGPVSKRYLQEHMRKSKKEETTS